MKRSSYRNIVAIIPARMGSTRFPGKPMAKIRGIPMIGHCYFRTRMCDELLDTFVTTCDEEIYDYIENIGGKVVMTSEKHKRATDRTAEAMLIVEKIIGKNIDIVVMVQGDEPMVTPNMITESLLPFEQDNTVNVVNLMTKIESIMEFDDPNEVKVVQNNNGYAIYFSREPIPSRRKGIKNVPMFKQTCIIPFKRDYLIKFNDMAETELERIESVDMMRIIENGEKIRMVPTKTKTYSVDTKKDLEKVENNMMKDNLFNKYKNYRLDR